LEAVAMETRHGDCCCWSCAADLTSTRDIVK